MQSRRAGVRLMAVLMPSLIVWLTGCGGGTSSSTATTERINGIAVPPPPDSAANAATLGGVDINGNGVRDDVDRTLATVFGESPSTHALAVRFSQTEQAAMMNPSADAIAAHLAVVTCVTDRALLSQLNRVTRSTVDTADRARAYANAFAGAGGAPRSCP